MLALEPRKVLERVHIVLSEFFDDILAHVAVVLLDLASDLELVLRRNARHLPTLSEQVQDELANVATGNGDMLDGRANNVAFGHRDDVGDTITRVDDCAGECAVATGFGGGPGGGESEDGLDGDVETGDVECLEEDLGSVLAVLGRVERRFGLRRAVSESRFVGTKLRESGAQAIQHDFEVKIQHLEDDYKRAA